MNLYKHKAFTRDFSYEVIVLVTVIDRAGE